MVDQVPEGTFRIFEKPSVGQRASICHWDLQFRFLTKEQCLSFINELLETTDIAWDFEYREEPENGLFHVYINDMSWARNLAHVAKMLERVDYKGI